MLSQFPTRGGSNRAHVRRLRRQSRDQNADEDELMPTTGGRYAVVQARKSNGVHRTVTRGSSPQLDRTPSAVRALQQQ